MVLSKDNIKQKKEKHYETYHFLQHCQHEELQGHL